MAEQQLKASWSKFKKDQLVTIMKEQNLGYKSGLTKDQIIDVLIDRQIEIPPLQASAEEKHDDKEGDPEHVAEGDEDPNVNDEDDYLAFIDAQTRQQNDFLKEIRDQQTRFFSEMNQDRQILYEKVLIPMTSKVFGSGQTHPNGGSTSRDRAGSLPTALNPNKNCSVPMQGHPYNVGNAPMQGFPTNQNTASSRYNSGIDTARQFGFGAGNVEPTGGSTSTFGSVPHLSFPAAHQTSATDQLFDRDFNAVFERRLQEVSKLDSRRFANLHPWSSQFSFVAARNATINKIESFKNSEIYRCITRYCALYFDACPGRARLYCYVLSKIPQPINESDQILKSLIRSVDISIETNCPLKTQDVDSLYNNYQIEKYSVNPGPSGTGPYSFRAPHEKKGSYAFNNQQSGYSQGHARSKNYCIDFQKNNCARKKENCRFKHKCEICEGDHGADSCNSK